MLILFLNELNFLNHEGAKKVGKKSKTLYDARQYAIATFVKYSTVATSRDDRIQVDGSLALHSSSTHRSKPATFRHGLRMELPTSSPGTTDKGRVWRHWSNHIHHRTTMQTPPWPTNVPFRSSQMAPNVSFGLPMNLNYATNQTFERRALRWFQLRWWTLSQKK